MGKRFAAYADDLVAFTEVQRVLAVWQNAEEVKRELSATEMDALREQYGAGMESITYRKGWFPNSVGKILRKCQQTSQMPQCKQLLGEHG